MNETLHLALIYGSVREGRFADTVAQWVLRRLQGNPDFAVDVIDPVADGHRAAGSALRERIGAADAFLVVTPEYNHSFPGALKSLIDSVGVEWQAKPVAFVSYGGISGGIRAVEHLRGIFAELQVVGIRDSVSFANAWEVFDAEQRPRNEQRYRRALARMLESLAWWGRILRRARLQAPQGEAA